MRSEEEFKVDEIKINIAEKEEKIAAKQGDINYCDEDDPFALLEEMEPNP